MSVQEFLTTTEISNELVELRNQTTRLAIQVGELANQMATFVSMVERLSGKQCAMCRGTGRFTLGSIQGPGPCEACNGRGY